MHPDRPVHLPLIRLFAAMPVTAFASILHRLTGVLLFAGARFLCYLFDLALAGQAGFEQAAGILATPAGRVALWVILTALAFHFLAGVRHLLLDLHIGDSLAAGRAGAWLSLVLTLGAAAGLRVLLW